MTEEAPHDAADNLLEIPEIKDAPMSTATAISSIALNFALKYWDLNMVRDGTLYQAYKLEGRTLEGLSLAQVFDTARQIEEHILGAPGRLSELVVEVVREVLEEQINTEEVNDPPVTP